MIHLTAIEAQQRLPELLVAASAGEIVEITQNNSTFHLTAIQPRAPRPRPPITAVPKAGRLKGQFIVPCEFGEPVEDLQEYVK